MTVGNNATRLSGRPRARRGDAIFLAMPGSVPNGPRSRRTTRTCSVPVIYRFTGDTCAVTDGERQTEGVLSHRHACRFVHRRDPKASKIRVLPDATASVRFVRSAHQFVDD
jgi:hypothetical protein